MSEAGQKVLLEGYPTLAEFIARDRDAAIYHKFERLSARSLLYQQSEIHDLEKQLDDMDQDEVKNIDDEEARKLAVDWKHFSTSTSVQARSRRDLQTKIKSKLKEYHEALMLESQVLSLNSPERRSIKVFQKWFKQNDVPLLWGRDKDLFSNKLDLVALAPVEPDRLNNFLVKYFGYFFKEKTQDILPRIEDLYYVSARRIQYAGLVVSTILSAILLIGAIVCLLLVSNQSIGLRVGMIVLFTCLFAAVVGLLTNARRAEIFGSTAAYAAVLVVFISNFNSP